MRFLLLAILVSGAAAAQAAAPDVRVHVVEKRPFTEAQRWELSFFGNAQVNPKFTQHAGLALELAYHLRENFAAQLGVLFFPYAVQSSLSEELLTRAGVAPDAAEAFLLRGAVLGGVELMPIYGKLDVFDGRILRLGVYLNAGLGAARTRLQLRPAADPNTGRTFGDTGYRPIASLGGGLRVFLGDRFTVRLELRDLAYSGYVSRVNGCNLGDVSKIEAAEAAGGTASGLSGGCNERAFGAPGTVAQLNAGAARDLLKTPSADVINNIAFQGGVSWLF
ncbi:MAG TPA: outer membrane beta-barrel domain-containing protein [Myxococcales bacterium]|nr:outer membrane beta-barrel domain-containing protein [Myxococcales bacterium]